MYKLEISNTGNIQFGNMKLSSIISAKLINQIITWLLFLGQENSCRLSFATRSARVSIGTTVTLVLCVYTVDTIYQRQININSDSKHTNSNTPSCFETLSSVFHLNSIDGMFLSSTT